MPVRGPTTIEMRGILGKIRGMGDLLKSGAMSKILAETARDLVDEGFAEGTAPDGKPWAPLISRDGQPLRDTRRLQSSFTYSTTPSRFELGTNVEYAATHQFGAEIRPKTAKRLRFSVRGETRFARKVVIPARPMLPSSVAPNSRWGVALRQAAEDAVEEVGR